MSFDPSQPGFWSDGEDELGVMEASLFSSNGQAFVLSDDDDADDLLATTSTNRGITSRRDLRKDIERDLRHDIEHLAKRDPRNSITNEDKDRDRRDNRAQRGPPPTDLRFAINSLSDSASTLPQRPTSPPRRASWDRLPVRQGNNSRDSSPKRGRRPRSPSPQRRDLRDRRIREEPSLPISPSSRRRSSRSSSPSTSKNRKERSRSPRRRSPLRRVSSPRRYRSKSPLPLSSKSGAKHDRSSKNARSRSRSRSRSPDGRRVGSRRAWDMYRPSERDRPSDRDRPLDRERLQRRESRSDSRDTPRRERLPSRSRSRSPTLESNSLPKAPPVSEPMGSTTVPVSITPKPQDSELIISTTNVADVEERSERKTSPNPNSPRFKDGPTLTKVIDHDNTRYFLVRCSDDASIERSQKEGFWPSSPLYLNKLSEAFEGSNVILIFLLTDTGVFQGYAELKSGPERPPTPKSFFPPNVKLQFRVEWVSKVKVTYEDTEDLRKKLKLPKWSVIRRNGHEFDQHLGQGLCELMDGTQNSIADCKMTGVTTSAPIRTVATSTEMSMDVDLDKAPISLEPVSVLEREREVSPMDVSPTLQASPWQTTDTPLQTITNPTHAQLPAATSMPDVEMTDATQTEAMSAIKAEAVSDEEWDELKRLSDNEKIAQKVKKKELRGKKRAEKAKTLAIIYAPVKIEPGLELEQSMPFARTMPTAAIAPVFTQEPAKTLATHSEQIPPNLPNAITTPQSPSTTAPVILTTPAHMTEVMETPATATVPKPQPPVTSLAPVPLAYAKRASPTQLPALRPTPIPTNTTTAATPTTGNTTTATGNAAPDTNDLTPVILHANHDKTTTATFDAYDLRSMILQSGRDMTTTTLKSPTELASNDLQTATEQDLSRDSPASKNKQNRDTPAMIALPPSGITLVTTQSVQQTPPTTTGPLPASFVSTGSSAIQSPPLLSPMTGLVFRGASSTRSNVTQANKAISPMQLPNVVDQVTSIKSQDAKTDKNSSKGNNGDNGITANLNHSRTSSMTFPLPPKPKTTQQPASPSFNSATSEVHQQLLPAFAEGAHALLGQTARQGSRAPSASRSSSTSPASPAPSSPRLKTFGTTSSTDGVNIVDGGGTKLPSTASGNRRADFSSAAKLQTQQDLQREEARKELERLLNMDSDSEGDENVEVLDRMNGLGQGKQGHAPPMPTPSMPPGSSNSNHQARQPRPKPLPLSLPPSPKNSPSHQSSLALTFLTKPPHGHFMFEGYDTRDIQNWPPEALTDERLIKLRQARQEQEFLNAERQKGQAQRLLKQQHRQTQQKQREQLQQHQQQQWRPQHEQRRQRQEGRIQERTNSHDSRQTADSMEEEYDFDFSNIQVRQVRSELSKSQMRKMNKRRH